MVAAALPAIEQFLRDEHLAYTGATWTAVTSWCASPIPRISSRRATPSTPNSPTSTSRPCRFASREPAVLRAVGLRPMKLGLDLQGGLYLLYQVDTQSAIAQLLDSYAQDLRRALSTGQSAVTPRWQSWPRGRRRRRQPARDTAGRHQPGCRAGRRQEGAAGPAIHDSDAAQRPRAAGDPDADKQIRDRQDYAIQQNLARPCATASISWAFPNPSCSARASIASMCSCRVCRTPPRSRTSWARSRPWSFAWMPPTGDPYDVAQHGNAPVGTKLYYDKRGPAAAAQARDHRDRR